MTIEVRQLHIRSRVGGEQAREGTSDTATDTRFTNQSSPETLAEDLLEEMDEWRRRFADAVNSPRER